MIIANNVLGFIANRIGFYANYDLMRLGEEANVGIEAIDFLSIHALKRSKMGPYALADYTGLLLSDGGQKTYAQSKRDAPFFQERSLPKEMVNCSGKGYY
ncbi:3-hydroxyacyl-CoA dehydrogenase family protein [Streptococcus dysgalactiae]|uniref:3-hydroxyacyl-CoA dehydrogenase family protein n=1 Tax=Streptococcus dysgalactiae TaxID=1334 RepID=UPI000F6E9216|nr:3-hydroxyacyl-CoA dehydrogenase family protein [Streptococcus dysgalactiae]MEE3743610.1 3-hydroxyacyl-CoA dehydrogenase family protein [Streptococcus dysgalactiae]VDZ40942.1 fatty oxidation complex protein [Streptococcus dysgalactiae subsp. dysgalactiae]